MDGFEFEYDGYDEGVDTDLAAPEDFLQNLLPDPGTAGTEYDLIGADPDEDGLWSHLMLDGDDVNPYVSN